MDMPRIMTYEVRDALDTLGLASVEGAPLCSSCKVEIEATSQDIVDQGRGVPEQVLFVLDCWKILCVPCAIREARRTSVAAEDRRVALVSAARLLTITTR